METLEKKLDEARARQEWNDHHATKNKARPPPPQPQPQPQPPQPPQSQPQSRQHPRRGTALPRLRIKAAAADKDQDVELAVLSKTWRELTHLKVAIHALEEQQRLFSTHTTKDSVDEASLESPQDPRGGLVKVQALDAKEAQLRAEMNGYRAQYEQLIESHALDKMRKTVLDLQHMLLLCERAEATSTLARYVKPMYIYM